MTITRNGNWTDLRTEFGLTADDEVDLHFGKRDPHTRYDEVMADVARLVESKLIEAQKNQRPYVLFVHGWSTSRPGQQTARSVVRGFMQSKQATPLIERAGCIRHETAFLAKIRLIDMKKGRS
jgi:hypothetical protein